MEKEKEINTEELLCKTWNDFKNEIIQTLQKKYGATREDAEDVLQESYIKMINAFRVEMFNGDNPKGFLFTISKNLLLDYFRRNKNTFITLDGDLYDVPTTDKSIEEKMIFDEIEKDVRNLIKNLTPNQQKVIIMHYYYGKKYAEIAKILDVPIHTAISRAYSARKKIKKVLS